MTDEVKELIERLGVTRHDVDLPPDVTDEIDAAHKALTRLSEQNAAKDARIAELEKNQIYISDEYRSERASEGFWRSCSGCHSTNEGASTGWFHTHPFFECEIGSGCSECGYLGAIWDDIDYEEMLKFDQEARAKTLSESS